MLHIMRFGFAQIMEKCASPDKFKIHVFIGSVG